MNIENSLTPLYWNRSIHFVMSNIPLFLGGYPSELILPSMRSTKATMVQFENLDSSVMK